MTGASRAILGRFGHAMQGEVLVRTARAFAVTTRSIALRSNPPGPIAKRSAGLSATAGASQRQRFALR